MKTVIRKVVTISTVLTLLCILGCSKEETPAKKTIENRIIEIPVGVAK